MIIKKISEIFFFLFIYATLTFLNQDPDPLTHFNQFECETLAWIQIPAKIQIRIAANKSGSKWLHAQSYIKNCETTWGTGIFLKNGTYILIFPLFRVTT
jgi:hypothetical protein